MCGTDLFAIRIAKCREGAKRSGDREIGESEPQNQLKPETESFTAKDAEIAKEFGKLKSFTTDPRQAGTG